MIELWPCPDGVRVEAAPPAPDGPPDGSPGRPHVPPGASPGSESPDAARVWERLCAANPRLHDGPLLTIATVAPGVVRCRRDTYRAFVVDEHVRDEGARVALGVTGVVVHAGRVLFGRRSAQVRRYAGMWETAPRGAVTPDPSEPISPAMLERQLREELEEETGLARDSVHVRAIAMVRDTEARSVDVVYALTPRAGRPPFVEPVPGSLNVPGSMNPRGSLNAPGSVDAHGSLNAPGLLNASGSLSAPESAGAAKPARDAWVSPAPSAAHVWEYTALRWMSCADWIGAEPAHPDARRGRGGPDSPARRGRVERDSAARVGPDSAARRFPAEREVLSPPAAALVAWLARAGLEALAMPEHFTRG